MPHVKKEPARAWLNRAFTALGDPLGREVVEAVRNSPGITVSELCEAFPVSRFTIMRQLNALEDAELLRRERDGKTKRIFLQRAGFERLTTGWLQQMAETGED